MKKPIFENKAEAKELLYAACGSILTKEELDFSIEDLQDQGYIKKSAIDEARDRATKLNENVRDGVNSALNDFIHIDTFNEVVNLYEKAYEEK